MGTKNYFLVFTFACFSYSALAFYDEQWNQGVVFLNSDEAIYGDINYNQDFEVVQCKTKQGIKAFSTYQVNFFRYFDELISINRFFKVFEEKHGQFKRKAFYEIVFEGSITMIRKKKFFVAHTNSYFIQEPSSYEREYDYFIYHDGTVKDLRRFKKTVINGIMKDKTSEINEFIKVGNLVSYNLIDQAIIIDFYNSLKDPEYTLLTNVVDKE